MNNIINAGRDYLEGMSEGKKQHDGGFYPPAGANKSPGGGIASFLGSLDDDKAKEEASKHAGDSGDKDLFGSILHAVKQKRSTRPDDDDSDVDEDYYVQEHRKTYNDEDQQANEKSLGTAAAMQALKLFNSGETKSSGQSAFLGLAMGEASKLFDAKSSQDKVSAGTSKDAVIQKAAEAAMKMYFKNQGEQQGGLTGLAAKFMK